MSLRRLDYILFEMSSCRFRRTGLASDLFYKEKVVAFIGPGCTYALDPTARLASYWNVPILTGMLYGDRTS